MLSIKTRIEVERKIEMSHFKAVFFKVKQKKKLHSCPFCAPD
jgi:hypothetical protein